MKKTKLILDKKYRYRMLKGKQLFIMLVIDYYFECELELQKNNKKDNISGDLTISIDKLCNENNFNIMTIKTKWIREIRDLYPELLFAIKNNNIIIKTKEDNIDTD